MNEQEKFLRTLPVCGCGSIGDALDTAYRVVSTDKECYHWHTVVDSLVLIIRGNVLARKVVADGLCTAENVAEYVNALNDHEHERSEMIGQTNSEQIAEWCDALFEKEGNTQ